MLESVGVAAIAIRGRTTEMKFRGKVRLEGMVEVVEAVRDIPVLGNGDIESPQDAEHMVTTTGCDGVVYARAPPGSHGCCPRIHQLLEHGEDPGELDHHGKLRVILRHVELCREHCEERRSLHVLRSRISRYARSLGHVKPLKEAFRLAEHTDEMLVAINEWLERDRHPVVGISNRNLWRVCRDHKAGPQQQSQDQSCTGMRRMPLSEMTSHPSHHG